jgi:type IV secretion system protein VirB10
MSKNNTGDTDKEFESIQTISKVTPNSKYKAIGMKAANISVLLSCILIAFVMLRPAQAVESQENSIFKSNNDDNFTLSDNLQEIQRLKIDDENKRKKEAEKKLVKKEKGQAYYPIKKIEELETSNHQPTQRVSDALLKRMHAQTTFLVDSNNQISHPITNPTLSSKTIKTGYQQTQNEKYLTQNQAVSSVSAKKIAHPEYVLPSGDMISATLLTALNSELPGRISAIVSRNAYSLTGKLLLPKGSIIEGSYSSQIILGQSRLLTVWNRVRLSNGIVVDLSAPGTDSIGRAGIGADNINRHFVQRFSSSILLSILGYYSATSGVSAGDQLNSESQYRSAIADSLQSASGRELQENMNIAPTLNVHQGDKINIFVNQDLSFYNVMPHSK